MGDNDFPQRCHGCLRRTLEWGGCGIQSCLGQALGLAGQTPVKAQFLHGSVGGSVGQQSREARSCESVAACAAVSRSVVTRCCCLGSAAAAGLPGGPACLDWLLPVSPAFMQPGSRLQRDGAAWLLVSSLFQSSLAFSSSSRQDSAQPGAVLSEYPWTVEVAALPGLPRSRGRTGPLGCLHLCDGV